MSRCVKTVFDRKILCSGTMTDYIIIKNRTLQGTTSNRKKAVEDFVVVDNVFGYLEAVSATTRFNGINIESNITHLVYIPFDQTIYELDKNTLFAEVERTRSRLFKLEKIMNYGEQDEYLVLYCKETGFADIEANEG